MAAEREDMGKAVVARRPSKPVTLKLRPCGNLGKEQESKGKATGKKGLGMLRKHGNGGTRSNTG